MTDGTATMTANNTQIDITGDLIPSVDVTYDIGSASLKWKDLYLSGTTIHLGDATITATGSNIDVGTIDGGAY